jgi:hypothetical protein
MIMTQRHDFAATNGKRTVHGAEIVASMDAAVVIDFFGILHACLLIHDRHTVMNQGLLALCKTVCNWK